MRIPSLVFIILALLVGSKYLKVADVKTGVIIGIALLWLMTLYISIHLKNKEQNTPRPVYLTN